MTETANHAMHNQFAHGLAIANAGVSAFSDTLRANLLDESPHVQATVESYISLLERGGKRTRGVLAVTGYEMYDGQDKETVVTAAGVVEAMHAYLLVMDDVADDSDMRRGGPAAHIQLRDYYTGIWGQDGASKLAIDTAQNAALYAQHCAQNELLGLDGAAPAQRLLALQTLNDGLARTTLGQALDMVSAHNDEATVDDILKVATYKTAFYSFLLPLQVGAALAGASSQELDRFTAYSFNAGIAYQLQDDVIGTFGNEAVTGKPAMSDIQEGKKTLLMALAYREASFTEREILSAAMGNAELTEPQFQECLEVIRATGALDEVQIRIGRYTAAACAAIQADAAPHWRPDQLGLLRDMALFSTQRKS